jgi:hypothetical protein
VHGDWRRFETKLETRTCEVLAEISSGPKAILGLARFSVKSEELREVGVPKVFADALVERRPADAVLGGRSCSQKHEHTEGVRSETKARRPERAPEILLERERRK